MQNDLMEFIKLLVALAITVFALLLMIGTLQSLASKAKPTDLASDYVLWLARMTVSAIFWTMTLPLRIILWGMDGLYKQIIPPPKKKKKKGR